MRLERHRRFVIGGSSPADEFVHAAIWIALTVEPWNERREGHLHALRRCEEEGWRWVDLARHPLRAVAGELAEAEVAAAEEQLRSWLARCRLRFYRLPALAAVSELGESEEEFRRRVLGALRRPAADARPAPGTAAELARIASSIEHHDVADVLAAVRRVEVGPLAVAAGVELAWRRPGPDWPVR